MSTNVVMTGLGLVLPGAGTPEEFWSLARSQHSQIRPITRFDPTGHANGEAGQVADTQLAMFNARLRKRMDRFCTMAMVATRSALADAGLQDGADAETTGVYIGNMFAGWEIAEPSMRRLCQIGYTGVSPFIASAWFPTAPQGQISIHWGFRGFSKTISADTASGAVAFGYAARAISEGRADVVLAGGAEAPVTPYSSTFTSTSGRVTPGSYRPFTSAGAGFQVGEGSVIFVLESRAHAEARGARILAEVGGFATGHAHSCEVLGTEGGEALTAVAGDALAQAGVAPEEIDYVGLDAQGTNAADAGEAAAVRALLGSRADDVPCSTVKPLTGHLLGAAPAVDLAAAVLTLGRSQVPLLTDQTSDYGLRLATDAGTSATNGPVRTALVNARGADGTVTSCVLQAT